MVNPTYLEEILNDVPGVSFIYYLSWDLDCFAAQPIPESLIPSYMERVLFRLFEVPNMEDRATGGNRAWITNKRNVGFLDILIFPNSKSQIEINSLIIQGLLYAIPIYSKKKQSDFPQVNDQSLNIMSQHGMYHTRIVLSCQVQKSD